MKKLVLLLMLTGMFGGLAIAQNGKGTAKSTPKAAKAKPAKAKAGATVKAEPGVHLTFTETEHNFGSVPEGPDAVHVFKFTNTGTEPIVVSSASAGCGCTVPSWPKDPIMPGKISEIKVAYHTNGRVGAIYKEVTVTYNGGQTSVLKITGTVVPQATDKGPGGEQIK